MCTWTAIYVETEICSSTITALFLNVASVINIYACSFSEVTTAIMHEKGWFHISN